MPSCLHAAHGRQDDFAHDAGVQLRRDDRRGRIGAHAAGVRALVAVEQTLVVLARRQRQHVLAVHHHDKARFLAVQEFLDHHARAGVAQFVVGEHGIDGRVRFFKRRCHDHALAGRESVGLDDDGRAFRVQIRVGGGDVRERFVFRRRNGVALHERLREVLRAFELRGFLGRAENLQAARAEQVDDTRRERTFRADHGQRNLLFLGEIGERGRIGDVDIEQTLVLSRAAVARRDINHLHARRLRELPCERMFATAGTDDE